MNGFYMTPAQRALLEFARDWQPLGDGTIERSIQTGIHGAAAEAVCKALHRKGLVDDTGAITEKGALALAPRAP